MIVGSNTKIISDIGMDMGMSVTSSESQAYGIYYDAVSDVQYVYNVGGFEDEAEILAEMYHLINTSMVTSSSGDILAGVGGSKISSFSFNCDSFGKVNGRTQYSKIIDTSNDYEFYLVHYFYSGLTNSGKSKSGMGIHADVDGYPGYGANQRLLSYGPTTSSGTTTVSFGGSVGVNVDPLLSVSATVGFNAS